jgi:hypothetical protein
MHPVYASPLHHHHHHLWRFPHFLLARMCLLGPSHHSAAKNCPLLIVALRTFSSYHQTHFAGCCQENTLKYGLVEKMTSELLCLDEHDNSACAQRLLVVQTHQGLCCEALLSMPCLEFFAPYNVSIITKSNVTQSPVGQTERGQWSNRLEAMI